VPTPHLVHHHAPTYCHCLEDPRYVDSPEPSLIFFDWVFFPSYCVVLSLFFTLLYAIPTYTCLFSFYLKTPYSFVVSSHSTYAFHFPFFLPSLTYFMASNATYRKDSHPHLVAFKAFHILYLMSYQYRDYAIIIGTKGCRWYWWDYAARNCQGTSLPHVSHWQVSPSFVNHVTDVVPSPLLSFGCSKFPVSLFVQWWHYWTSQWLSIFFLVLRFNT